MCLEGPDAKLAIEGGGGETSVVARLASVGLDKVDEGLVLGLEDGSDGLVLTLVDLALEHLTGSRGGTDGGALLSLLLIDVAGELPSAISATLKELREAVVAGGDDGALVGPLEVDVGEAVAADDLVGEVLSALRDVDEGDGGVVAAVGELVARGGEADAVDPGGGEVLAELLSEGQTRAEGRLTGLLVETTDERREDAHLGISRGRGDQDASVVPVDPRDGRVVLLQVLADPPVVVLLEVANRDDLGS